MLIKNYYDLDVWKLSRALVKSLYELTACIPDSEQYGLVAQLRRAAISVPSNIAEGHSRHSTRDFVHFLSIAIGSLAEMDTQLLLAEDLRYLTRQQTQNIFEAIHQLQRMLHGLRKSLKAKEVDNA
jgi:four helix bundle protein